MHIKEPFRGSSLLLVVEIELNSPLLRLVPNLPSRHFAYLRRLVRNTVNSAIYTRIRYYELAAENVGHNGPVPGISVLSH